MIRKISYIVISAAILVSGYVAVKKLNYWERSIWIFKTNASDQRFEGRMGRGGREGERGVPNFGRGDGERPADFRVQPGTRGMREIPDSMRARFEQQRRQGGEFRGRDPRPMDRYIPDSLRQQFRQGDGRMGGMQPGGERGRFERSGRDGFRDGKRVRLQAVGWFLAVFAAFTVITIYADKAFDLVRRKVSR